MTDELEDLTEQLIETERQRDAAKHERDEARAACVTLRAALEALMGAFVEVCKTSTGSFSQSQVDAVSSAKSALQSNAGSAALLDRMRRLEDAVKELKKAIIAGQKDGNDYIQRFGRAFVRHLENVLKS